jgi:hypothetical protein
MKLFSQWDITPANDNAGPSRPAAPRVARVTVVHGGQVVEVLVSVAPTGSDPRANTGRARRPVAT